MNDGLKFIGVGLAVTGMAFAGANSLAIAVVGVIGFMFAAMPK